MKHKRFTEEQIIGILKEAEAGSKTADLARTNAGVVYVTDLEYDYATDTGNPWAKLPTYWSQLLGTVDAINKSRALPSC